MREPQRGRGWVVDDYWVDDDDGGGDQADTDTEPTEQEGT